MDQQQVGVDRQSLEKRPGVLMVGSPNVGKRTLLSRLLSVDFEDSSDSSLDVLAYGWTLNTKYYTADVSIWMAHLHNEFSVGTQSMYDRVAALVMVFDMNDLSSFVALKKWVSSMDIQKFEILLCIGNKVDLLPGHSAHVEYRRRLLKLGESGDDPNFEFSEYGISETEGSSLLGDEEPSSEIKRSCMEWCLENNIEYIEACASNTEFDKCLSIDGDSQGVERLLGALSAHMWSGMILKSGDTINQPSLPENQDLSEEDSDYEIEYEILSAGSAEPWDDTDGGWVSATVPVAQNLDRRDYIEERDIRLVGGEMLPSTSTSQVQEEIDERAMPDTHEPEEALDVDEGSHYELEDLEQIMSEIGSMRDSMRLMPDFQRREMAAKLAMKMATMFGDSSGDAEGLDQ